MGMPIRTKRTIFYFKLNVIVKVRLLAKFDYCTIRIDNFSIWKTVLNIGLHYTRRCKKHSMIQRRYNAQPHATSKGTTDHAGKVASQRCSRIWVYLVLKREDDSCGWHSCTRWWEGAYRQSTLNTIWRHNVLKELSEPNSTKTLCLKTLWKTLCVTISSASNLYRLKLKIFEIHSSCGMFMIGINSVTILWPVIL